MTRIVIVEVIHGHACVQQKLDLFVNHVLSVGKGVLSSFQLKLVFRNVWDDVMSV